MFTGIIEQTGTLESISSQGGGRVTIRHRPWADPLDLGESIAVQGVCLTVAAIGTGSFDCDLLDETRRATAIAGKCVGCDLNLERAIKAGGRFGGHFVSGHVDGTAEVDSIRTVGRDWALCLRCDQAPWHVEIVVKGSVAIDGVSLTVVDMSDDRFVVHCIPHTWAHTTLSSLQRGQMVNIETDILGKYVRRFIADGPHVSSRLSPATLISAGY